MLVRDRLERNEWDWEETTRTDGEVTYCIEADEDTYGEWIDIDANE